MRTKYLVLAALSITLFAACQKEPDGSILTPPGGSTTCKLQKATYYDDASGGVTDTAGFVYTGDQLTRINHMDFFVTLEYSNNKISKKNYTPTGSTTPIIYDQFTYNSDGTINKVASFLQIPGLPIPVPYYQYDFVWSSGKLASVSEKGDTTSTGGGPLILIYVETFTYTGNNITQCISEDVDAHVKDTLIYQYDNKANYFGKNPSLLFTDNFFLDFDPVTFPFALSANNVTRISVGASGSNLTYTATDKDQLKDLSLNGKKQSDYIYKCQ